MHIENKLIEAVRSLFKLKFLGNSDTSYSLSQVLGSRTGAPISSTVYSLWATASSEDEGVISVVGGEYQILGEAWTSEAGTIVEGDSVRVRLNTSGEYLTETVLTLTCNTEVYTFSVTTGDVSRVTVGGDYVVIGGEYITIGS